MSSTTTTTSGDDFKLTVTREEKVCGDCHDPDVRPHKVIREVRHLVTYQAIDGGHHPDAQAMQQVPVVKEVSREEWQGEHKSTVTTTKYVTHRTEREPIADVPSEHIIDRSTNQSLSLTMNKPAQQAPVNATIYNNEGLRECTFVEVLAPTKPTTTTYVQHHQDDSIPIPTQPAVKHRKEQTIYTTLHKESMLPLSKEGTPNKESSPVRRLNYTEVDPLQQIASSDTLDHSIPAPAIAGLARQISSEPGIPVHSLHYVPGDAVYDPESPYYGTRQQDGSIHDVKTEKSTYKDPSTGETVTVTRQTHTTKYEMPLQDNPDHASADQAPPVPPHQRSPVLETNVHSNEAGDLVRETTETHTTQYTEPDNRVLTQVTVVETITRTTIYEKPIVDDEQTIVSPVHVDQSRLAQVVRQRDSETPHSNSYGYESGRDSQERVIRNQDYAEIEEMQPVAAGARSRVTNSTEYNEGLRETPLKDRRSTTPASVRERGVPLPGEPATHERHAYSIVHEPGLEQEQPVARERTPKTTEYTTSLQETQRTERQPLHHKSGEAIQQSTPIAAMRQSTEYQRSLPETLRGNREPAQFSTIRYTEVEHQPVEQPIVRGVETTATMNRKGIEETVGQSASFVPVTQMPTPPRSTIHYTEVPHKEPTPPRSTIRYTEVEHIAPAQTVGKPSPIVAETRQTTEYQHSLRETDRDIHKPSPQRSTIQYTEVPHHTPTPPRSTIHYTEVDHIEPEQLVGKRVTTTTTTIKKADLPEEPIVATTRQSTEYQPGLPVTLRDNREPAPRSTIHYTEVEHIEPESLIGKRITTTTTTIKKGDLPEEPIVAATRQSTKYQPGLPVTLRDSREPAPQQSTLQYTEVPHHTPTPPRSTIHYTEVAHIEPEPLIGKRVTTTTTSTTIKKTDLPEIERHSVPIVAASRQSTEYQQSLPETVRAHRETLPRSTIHYTEVEHVPPAYPIGRDVNTTSAYRETMPILPRVPSPPRSTIRYTEVAHIEPTPPRSIINYTEVEPIDAEPMGGRTRQVTRITTTVTENRRPYLPGDKADSAVPLTTHQTLYQGADMRETPVKNGHVADDWQIYETRLERTDLQPIEVTRTTFINNSTYDQTPLEEMSQRTYPETYYENSNEISSSHMTVDESLLIDHDWAADRELFKTSPVYEEEDEASHLYREPTTSSSTIVTTTVTTTETVYTTRRVPLADPEAQVHFDERRPLDVVTTNERVYETLERTSPCGSTRSQDKKNFYSRNNLLLPDNRAKKTPEPGHNPFCVSCGREIEGRCVTALAPSSQLPQKFHPQCFACTYCTRPLNTRGTYKEHDRKPYCHECFYRLYSGLIYAFDEHDRAL